MKKILLISTGGTIASRKTDSGLAPQITPEELLSYIPDISFICEIDTAAPMNIDSTNITPDHWLKIAGVIEENYSKYDGFVICHGTDTLAYSAAALSYLIQNPDKPIVLTGAQRPIDSENTDAKINLTDSIHYACESGGGVVIIFGSHVIAGTRARKMRTKSYNAFTSLNFPDIASIRESRIIRYIPEESSGETVFYHDLDPRVLLLKLTPGMAPEVFPSLGKLCDGLIIESYGVGGIPDCYLDELSKLIENGKTVIMATQVPHEGSDLSVYQVGHFLKQKYSVLETYDMTLESTITKLMWALGQSREPKEIRKLFCTTVNHDLLF